MIRPKIIFNPNQTPQNSPFEPKRSENDPWIKSKLKVTNEGNFVKLYVKPKIAKPGPLKDKKLLN